MAFRCTSVFSKLLDNSDLFSILYLVLTISFGRMEMESKGNNVIDSLLRLGRMYVMFTDKQKMKIPDVKKGKINLIA